ncbi:MAG: flagellar hook protein FlgE [Gammaproteobacteria bacterium]|nr:flagellar hook protein FlgE [Gammaproteobacteria bacterium]
MPFNVALTGLNAASTDLEVTANNIANSNTTGFKRSRTEFGDIYANTNLGGGGNSAGQGVQVTKIKQDFGQGSISFTDNALDMSISGRGFFRLSDNGTVSYSRSGAFSVDRNGFVANAQGQHLTGYLADTAGNLTGALGDLQIDTADQPPQATTDIAARLNVNASSVIPGAFTVGVGGPDPATYNHSTSLTVYDSLGSSHIASTYYRKNAVNDWQAFLFVDNAQVDGPDAITFNTDGSLNQINGGPATTLTSPAFNPGGGAANMTLTLDYSEITQFGSPFGVSALSQDGYSTGRLTAIDIDQSGVLFARYTNGQSRSLGQVALANFANVEGLRPIGNTGWTETVSSGSPLVGAPQSADLGGIESGALEESNVDLTQELISMITSQRNFQANAQVISTADTITQTIINIR